MDKDNHEVAACQLKSVLQLYDLTHILIQISKTIIINTHLSIFCPENGRISFQTNNFRFRKFQSLF